MTTSLLRAAPLSLLLGWSGRAVLLSAAALGGCGGAGPPAAPGAAATGAAASTGGSAGDGGAGGGAGGAAGLGAAAAAAGAFSTAGGPGAAGGGAGAPGTGGGLPSASGGSGGAPACDPSHPPPLPTSSGDDIFQTIGDYKLTGRGPDGAETAFSLHDRRAPCGDPSARLLVLRIDAPWCAPCQLAADQARQSTAPLDGHGLVVINVLYAGADNALPLARDLAAWQAAHPSLPGELARSTDGAIADLVSRRGSLPIVYVVDPRTMTILDVQEDPRAAQLAGYLAGDLAQVGGDVVDVPAEADFALVDGRFTPDQWALLQTMSPLPAPPPSPSNAVADRPEAAALGEALFADAALAGSKGFACAHCHQKDKGFADGLPVAQAAGTGRRNTPGLSTAAFGRWAFWDGRADTLWSQALGPLENPLEMDGSRLEVAHHVQGSYKPGYEALFGPLPDLLDTKRFPAAGKPGDAAYDAMAPADQLAVSRVHVNVGKALEAFERTLAPPPGRFDAYVAGDTAALTPAERDGLQSFVINGCATCHNGPLFSDGAFHNVLFPGSKPPGPVDTGRAGGVPQLLASAFRADGVFSDDPSAGARLAALLPGPETLGQMKTPSLRTLLQTAPWGHGGSFTDLAKIIEHYSREKPFLADPSTTGARDPAMRRFMKKDGLPIIAFLKALSGLPPDAL